MEFLSKKEESQAYAIIPKMKANHPIFSRLQQVTTNYLFKNGTVIIKPANALIQKVGKKQDKVVKIILYGRI